MSRAGVSARLLCLRESFKFGWDLNCSGDIRLYDESSGKRFGTSESNEKAGQGNLSCKKACPSQSATENYLLLHS